MLVSCLALHTPLEQTQQLHPQTRVLVFADDCYLQGPARHAAAAFHSLRDLAATICLHMQLPKCSVYGHDAVAAEEVAQELGIGHAKAGMMACGTPLGTPAFITPFLAEHTEGTCSLIDALLALPLATGSWSSAPPSNPAWTASLAQCRGPFSKTTSAGLRTRSRTLHTPSCTVHVPQAPQRITSPPYHSDTADSASDK
jgi:hypothetical protein